MIEGFVAGLAVGIVVSLIGVGVWLPPAATRRDLSLAERRSRARHATALGAIDAETWEDIPSNVRVLDQRSE